ncbi:MAG: cysteine hydrolase [Verrucomicrobia bacterium]|nr:cysteine hydrolase [Verrucomicrobiota bacterium]
MSERRKRRWFTGGLALVSLMALGSRLVADEPSSATNASAAVDDLPARAMPTPDFFQGCAFICVDIQPGERKHLTDEAVPKGWRKGGFTAADVNAATDYAFDVAYPNARLVADACRRLRLPMIFLHWGSLFRDGMDLDPEIRKTFLTEYGTNYAAWAHCIQDPQSRPADELGVRPGEYVLPKTGQDAFTSSNLGFLLTNLNVRNLVFVGGHTEACLGETARSARERGFRTLCVVDATFNARESSRLKGIREAKFDFVLTTDEFVKFAQSAANALSH